VTAEWNKLISRKAITHDKESGRYQDASLQQVLREVGKMYNLQPQVSAPSSGAKAAPKICRFYIKGNCKFGESCTRRHGHETSGAKVAAAISKSDDDPTCDWCNSKHSRVVRCETEKRAMKKWRSQQAQDADEKSKKNATNTTANNKNTPFGQKPKSHRAQVLYRGSDDDDDSDFSCGMLHVDMEPSSTDHITAVGVGDGITLMSGAHLGLERMRRSRA